MGWNPTYVSNLEHDLELDYDCKRCGCAARATVSAKGSGTGAKTMFLSHDDAAALAVTEAAQELVDHAKTTLGLVRCPRCRRRRLSAVISFAIKNVIYSVLIAALSALLYFVARDEGGAVAGVMYVAIAAIIVGNVVYQVQLFRGADSRTQFSHVRERPLPGAVARYIDAGEEEPIAPTTEEVVELTPLEDGPKLLR